MKKVIMSILAGIVLMSANSALAEGMESTFESTGDVSGWAIALPIIFGVGMMIVVLAVALFCVVFWVMMVIAIAKNEKENDLVMWLILILLFGVPVAIIYYFVKKRPLDKERKLKEQTESASK